jgi:asparagine synthase (glutamine-hydrolysing)
MCGIAGIATNDLEAQPHLEDLERMCDAIVHRGPDDQGFYVAHGVGLGMRRLSIIDVAGGQQPIRNEDHSVWVVFNGEIYNFPELRREMETRGHHFYTRSDTEVIVHLYEELGSGFVRELRGMFAIALWDERRKTLLLARDRLGKKPLCYALDRGALYFGSEIKSILRVAPELTNLNSRALVEYLDLGYVPDPLTAFSSIQKLPAGHLLEFCGGKVSVRQYWDLPYYDTYFPESEEECLLELERRLFGATHRRMIADVPLGAFLSGGVDSSIIVAIMASASPAPVKTFSIGFKAAEFNETHYARMVARKFGTEHREMILEPDVVRTVELLTSSLEEPFGDSSMLPTYFVSQLARQHVTVALSGDGGDEIFAGYDRYRINAQREIFERIPASARKFYRSRIFPRVPQNMKGRRFSFNASLDWRERYVDELSFLPGFERDMPLLSAEFRKAVLGSGEAENVLQGYFGNSPAVLPLSQMLYVDTKTYLVGDILTKVDRMSMLNSLEVRSPMLDHELVEWAAGLSATWKMRGRQQKYILVKLAERLGVPREALHRKKQGFALPLKHWMRNELKDMLRILVEPRTLQRGYFEPAAIRKLMDDHFTRGRDMSHALWRLLMFELWHRNFLEKFVSDAGVRSLPSAVAPWVGVAGNNSMMASAAAGE